MSPHETVDAPTAELHTAAMSAHDARRYRQVVRAPMRDTDADLPQPDVTGPLHHFVVSHPVVQDLLERTWPEATSLVHLTQDIQVDAPLPAGTPVEVSAGVDAVRPAADGTANVRLRSDVRSPDGVHLCTLRAGVLLGGVHAAPMDATDAVPATRVSPPLGAVRESATIHVGRDLVRRYAECSGDDNPIHLDDAAARAAGFDRAIAHGMSLVAMAVELVADRRLDSDVSRVTGVGARFSAPVEVGQDVDFTLAEAGPATIAFGARCGTAPALKSGWLTYSERPC